MPAPDQNLHDSIRDALGPAAPGLLDQLCLLVMMAAFGRDKTWAWEQLRQWGRRHLSKLDQRQVQCILVTLRELTGSDIAVTATPLAWIGLCTRDGYRIGEPRP